jgi:hypothetical protein
MRTPDTAAPLDADDWANRSCIDRWERLLLAAHTDDADKQWKKVKEILEGIGVDADAVLIGPGISAKQRWSLNGFVNEAVCCSLRDELPYIIERCDIDLRITSATATPLGLADEQDRTVELCHKLLARLGDDDPDGEPSKHNRISPESHWLQFPHLSEVERRAGAVLQELVTKLERCRDELAAMGTSRGRQNRELHVQFLRALERIWLDNVGKDVKWDASNQFAEFLIACAKPFFEDADTAVDNFIKGLKRSRNRE